MSDLSQLIEHSKSNEAIAKKLFEIETEILTCQSSSELLQLLLNSIQEKFALSGIHLLLVEPTPISYLLSGNMQQPWHQNIPDECQLKCWQSFTLVESPF